MKTYTAEELAQVLASHKAYLAREGGQRANLSAADLSYANLRYANLSDADLSYADLSDADLRYANLSAANLSDADLSDADLRYANLSDANLSDADLSDANLSAADLSYADLRAANLSAANLHDADLSDILVSWQSHALLGEILFRAAGRLLDRQALALLIAKHIGWCWSVWLDDSPPDGVLPIEWENIVINQREWALSELAKWVKQNDGAPDAVRAFQQKEVPA